MPALGELPSLPISQLWHKSVDVSILPSHFPSNHLILGTITPCCDWTLPMFPRCIWHKVEALLQNWWVSEGTFMYPTGMCKPSFQIKSSEKSNLISGHKMFISKSWSFCLVHSTSKRLKHPHPREKRINRHSLFFLGPTTHNERSYKNSDWSNLAVPVFPHLVSEMSEDCPAEDNIRYFSKEEHILILHYCTCNKVTNSIDVWHRVLLWSGD